MGYSLEVSYDLGKHPGPILSDIKELASKYGCDAAYEHYEMSGNMKHSMRQSIITILFSDDLLSECANLLAQLKKMRQIRIDSFYTTESCKLLYASKGYLRNVEGYQAIDYQNTRLQRERSYSDGEIKVIDQLKPKKRHMTIVDENTHVTFTSTEHNNFKKKKD